MENKSYNKKWNIKQKQYDLKKENTRERMIKEMKNPYHNPFQGELASEEWDKQMDFLMTGDCGCPPTTHCYCYDNL